MYGTAITPFTSTCSQPRVGCEGREEENRNGSCIGAAVPQPGAGNVACFAALQEEEGKASRVHDDEGSVVLHVASTVAPAMWTGRGAWWNSPPLRGGCHLNTRLYRFMILLGFIFLY